MRGKNEKNKNAVLSKGKKRKNKGTRDGDKKMRKKWKKAAGTVLSLFLMASSVQTGYAATQWVTIVGTDYVMDSFHGVDAVYTSEKNDAADQKYSCAAYVKKYYQAIYNIGVYNLMDEGPPVVRDAGVGFKKVTEPKEGDIVFWPVSTNGNNHSAIVKKVEGNIITLIEQNYKTGTVGARNRTITYPSDKFRIYRLEGNFTENIPTQEHTVTQENTNEPISIIMDTYTISIICDRFRYGAIIDVTGNQNDAEQKLDKEADAQSYELKSDTPFCFTLDDEKIKGWYLNQNKWKEITPGKEVTAKEAYFTIYEKEEWTPIAGELPGLEDDVIPVFADGGGAISSNSYAGRADLFTDVPSGHWAYDSIQKCIAMGLFNGYADGSFQPDQVLTRAEFAVLLAKAAGITTVEGGNTEFADVSAADWYSGYVNYGKSYLKGKSGYFYPMEGAAREDVCAAVLNVLGFTNLNVDMSILDSYYDSAQIQAENKTAVAFAISIEMMKGFEDGSFRPKAAITRAEAAVVFAMMY